jgi:hypothetical protein
MIILLDENFPLRFYTRLQKVSQLNIFYSATGKFTTETSSFGLDGRTAIPNPRRRLRGCRTRLQGEHHLVACVAIYGDRSTSRDLAERREAIPFQEVG